MIRILIVILFFSYAGCATSSVDDFQKSKNEHELKKSRVSLIEDKYKGAEKESFLEEFGEPSDIRYGKAPYSLDKNCIQNGCPEGFADEVWFYEYKEGNILKGVTFYNILAVDPCRESLAIENKHKPSTVRELRILLVEFPLFQAWLSS